MQTEYEGVCTELSDFEQTLQATKQSDEGHHLEAGRVSLVLQPWLDILTKAAGRGVGFFS